MPTVRGGPLRTVSVAGRTLISLVEAVTKGRILVCDDDPLIVDLLLAIVAIEGFTDTHSTSDPREAVELFKTLKPDLLILDLNMPHMDGFEVLERLRPLVGDQTYIPILVLTGDGSPEAKQRALGAGASDYLLKPFDKVEAVLRIRNLLETRKLHLSLRRHNTELEARVKERTRELQEAYFDTMRRLARAAEHRDDATGDHTRRVSEVAGSVADQLGLAPETVEGIRLGAVLHDLGKIAVPDNVLLKPDVLNPAELEIMRSHTIVGAELLSGSNSEIMQVARQIALAHHERWDGGGYPYGLKGEAIPLSARIVSVADTFDALMHERPYKKAWHLDDALVEIERCIGAQFDPTIAGMLIELARAQTFANTA